MGLFRGGGRDVGYSLWVIPPKRSLNGAPGGTLPSRTLGEWKSLSKLTGGGNCAACWRWRFRLS